MITCVYVALKLRAQLFLTFGLISLQNYIKFKLRVPGINSILPQIIAYLNLIQDFHNLVIFDQMKATKIISLPGMQF